MNGLVVRRDLPDVAVVQLAGEQDEYTTTRLERSLQELLADGMGVIVDLGAATFVDSTTVGRLVAASATAQARNLPFAVVLADTTGPAVQRLFELTRLEQVLPVAPTFDGAVALARGRITWPGTERRSGRDRRSGLDRRSTWAARPVLERRAGLERRSGLDRRNGHEN